MKLLESYFDATLQPIFSGTSRLFPLRQLSRGDERCLVWWIERIEWWRWIV